MHLQAAVSAYLAGIKSQGREHQLQAKIILPRMAAWLVSQEAAEGEHSIWPITSLDQLARHHLSAFLESRQHSPGKRKGSTLSNATINKEVRYIKLFLKYISEEKILFGLPERWEIPKLKKYRDPTRIPRWLNETELDMYFKSTRFARRTVVPGVPAPQSFQALLLLAFTTAMRRRALFGVPRPTVDQLRKRELRLPAELDKAGVERIFPLSDLTCEVISRLPGRPGEPIFYWSGNYRSLYHELESMQTKAGIPKEQQSRLHVLRSSGATHMIKEGAELSTVQRHLGHSTPQITEKFYLGLLTDLQRQAVNSLYVPLSQIPRTLPDDYPTGAASD